MLLVAAALYLATPHCTPHMRTHAHAHTRTGLNDTNRSQHFQMRHFKSIGSEGVAYCCRPEFSGVVEALNSGLRKFKRSGAYGALCDRYPSIVCDGPATAEALIPGAALATRLVRYRYIASALRWNDWSDMMQRGLPTGSLPLARAREHIQSRAGIPACMHTQGQTRA